MSKNRKKKLKKKIKKQLEKQQSTADETNLEKHNSEGALAEEKPYDVGSKFVENNDEECDAKNRMQKGCEKGNDVGKAGYRNDGNIEGNGHDNDDIHMKNCEKGQHCNEDEKDDNDHDMDNVEADKKRNSSNENNSDATFKDGTNCMLCLLFFLSYFLLIFYSYHFILFYNSLYSVSFSGYY